MMIMMIVIIIIIIIIIIINCKQLWWNKLHNPCWHYTSAAFLQSSTHLIFVSFKICNFFFELIHSIILLLLINIIILNHLKCAKLVLPFPIIIHVVYIVFLNTLYCPFVFKQYLNASDRTIPTYSRGLFPILLHRNTVY